MTAVLKPLSTLPISQQIYHIDAIGDFRRNPNCSVNHLLDLMVTPVSSEYLRTRFPIESASFSQVQQSRYQISIGEFFEYAAGSFFKNGKVIWRPSKPNFKKRIMIGDKTCRYISADHKFETSIGLQWLIPKHEYRLGSALGSRILAIGDDADPYAVLLPAIEVFRYFYAGSSKLNQTIMSSTVTDLNKIINLDRHKFDPLTRELTLVLRKDYATSDAYLVGQWKTNPFSYNQVLRIWNKLVRFQQHESAPNRLPFEILPPFEGPTTLKAYGRYINNPLNPKKRRFFVLQIIECCGLLPFDTIHLGRDNDASKGLFDNPKERHLKPIAFKKRRITRKATDKGQNVPFLNPSARDERQIIDFKYSRFPHIQIKPLAKLKTTHRSDNSPSISGPPLESQSTSQENYGEDVAQPVSIAPFENIGPDIQPKKDSIPANFDSFERICRHLNERSEVKCTIDIAVNAPDFTSMTNAVIRSSFPIRNHRQAFLPWSSILSQEGHFRERQAIIKAVYSLDGIFYLMEIERELNADGKPASGNKFAIYIFANSRIDRINESQLELLLLELAECKFKRYRSVFSLLNLSFTTRRHRGMPSDVAKGILDKTQCLVSKLQKH